VYQEIKQENIVVSGAGTYTLRLYAKATSVVTIGLNVNIFNSVTYATYLFKSFYMPVANRWYLFTAEVNLPATTVNVLISTGGAAGPTGYVYIDTVELIG
jgi:hypothetical protein